MKTALKHIEFSDDALTSSLRAICEFQSIILKNEIADDILNVDFKDVRYVSPLWIACAKTFLSQKNIKCENISSYLTQIRFNEPFTETEIESVRTNYANKTYFPITQFSNTSDGNERDSMLSVLEELITKNTNVKSNIVSAISYLLSELTDNILEHSEASYGYVVSQFFPSKQYIDIVIADNGKGILDSFQRHNFPIHTEEDAMRAVNDRKSSKDLPYAENRGYGIYTSKKILSKGLDGEFAMLSGQIVYHLTKGTETYLKLPDPIKIQGTVILLRIPCKVNAQFNISNFFE